MSASTVRLEQLATQDKDLPVVVLSWTSMDCPICDARSWELWHAPEGGLMVQCDKCHVTIGLRVDCVVLDDWGRALPA